MGSPSLAEQSSGQVTPGDLDWWFGFGFERVPGFCGGFSWGSLSTRPPSNRFGCKPPTKGETAYLKEMDSQDPWEAIRLLLFERNSLRKHNFYVIADEAYQLLNFAPAEAGGGGGLGGRGVGGGWGLLLWGGMGVLGGVGWWVGVGWGGVGWGGVGWGGVGWGGVGWGGVGWGGVGWGGVGGGWTGKYSSRDACSHVSRKGYSFTRMASPPGIVFLRTVHGQTTGNRGVLQRLGGSAASALRVLCAARALLDAARAGRREARADLAAEGGVHASVASVGPGSHVAKRGAKVAGRCPGPGAPNSVLPSYGPRLLC